MKYSVITKYFDGRTETVPAATIDEALRIYSIRRDNHIEDHLEDLEFDVERIAILNEETRIVELVTDVDLDGEKISEFHDGDIVRFVDRWSEPGERKYRFKVTNIHEGTGSCLLICLNSNSVIGHSEIGYLEMITPATMAV